MAHDVGDITAENRQIRLAQVVVVGFISLLVVVAIGLPLVGRIKSERAVGTATENLRASGRALLVYAQDWGGIERGLPGGGVAVSLLSRLPTCDPEDSWRANCSVVTAAPMIGSFAYVRSTKYFTNATNWKALLGANPNPDLLIDPFRSKEHIPFFVGDEPMGGYGYASLPIDLLRFRADGSITSTDRLDGNSYPFKWPTAFWACETPRSIPAELTTWVVLPAPPVAAPVKKGKAKGKHP